MPFEFNIRTIVAYAVGILLFFVFGYVGAKFVKRWYFKNWARKKHELDLVEMKKRWQRIQKLLDGSDPETDRLAVIEADKLLDQVLKAMHMPGNTFALRMKFAQNKYYELKRVRWAHGLRNNLVHEPDFNLKRKQAKAAVRDFEKALKLLGAL